MATKKQRRADALVKREVFLKQEQLNGLAAQRQDKERREANLQRIKDEAERVNRRHKAILATAFMTRDLIEEN